MTEDDRREIGAMMAEAVAPGTLRDELRALVAAWRDLGQAADDPGNAAVYGCAVELGRIVQRYDSLEHRLRHGRFIPPADKT